MRALRLHGPRDLRLHDEPVPTPAWGEVLIQVKSVGVCASDLHYYRDGRIGTTVITDPIVIGHEASGVIAALGDGVSDTLETAALAVGDRVAIEPAKPCMQCEWCRTGHYNVCPGIPFFGTPPTDGCFRDYIAWPARLALRVPDTLTFDEIAIVEPLAIGVYVVKLAQPRPDDVVAVLGAGGVGLSVLQAARADGVRCVIVSEPVPERREMALRMGASEVIDPSASNAEDEFARLTGGRGADVVIECTGEEDAVRESCKIARVLGRVMVVGIPNGDDYPFDASTARRKQLTATFVRRSNETTGRAIELVAEGKVDAASLATHRFPLEQAAEAIELAIARADGVIRAMVVVSE